MSAGSRLAISEGMAWTSGFASAAPPRHVAETSAAVASLTTMRAKKRRSIDMSESSGCSGGQTWLEIAGWEGRLADDDDRTGDGMVMADIDQGRLRRRAASDQPAGIRRVDRARDLALQPQSLALHAPLRDRRSREQRTRVGMPGIAEDALRRSDLDDAAQIHHRDTVGDVLDDLQVVADEEIGQVQPALQIEQEIEDLAAHRDIERGGRFVEDDDVRRDRDGAGDADALALAAAQLVRVALEMDDAEAHHLDQLAHPRRPRRARQVEMQAQRLVEHLANAHARIERGVGILEHHLDAPVDPRQETRRERQDRLAVDHHVAAARLDQPHDAARDRRFSRAALTHQGQRLAGGEVEAHPVDRDQVASAVDRKILAQLAHLQDGVAGRHVAAPTSWLAANSRRV